MTYSPAPILTVPLSSTAHALAQQFAAEQADAQKGRQVYLNTLAVWAVHCYLGWLRVDADLEQSQSWHPGLRALLDVADLVLPQLGRLECRPVLPGETAIALPTASMGDRIGYVAVQFRAQLDGVELLGFVPASDVTEDGECLAISALRPLEAMVDHLSHLEAIASTLPVATPSIWVNLGQWLQHSYEIGWQTVEDLFGASTPALAFRQVATRRAKRLEWQPGIPSQPALALVVSLTPETPEQRCVHLQICSLSNPAELPSRLTLKILTETGDLFREITTGSTDTFMQYEFTGQPGERFSVEVALGEVRLREQFVI